MTEQPNTGCEHCPDGHAEPTSRPWGVFVASERDGDGQPTHLYVAPTADQHVAESDAQWVRDRLNKQFPDLETIAHALAESDNYNLCEVYCGEGSGPFHSWQWPYVCHYRSMALIFLKLIN